MGRTTRIGKTPKEKKLKPLEELTAEEFRDLKSHKGGLLNQWDQKELVRAKKIWKEQQKPGSKGNVT